MNILIKNADFSAVSLGKAGNVEVSSTVTNIYFERTGYGYIGNGVKVLCFDVSQLAGSKLKITSYITATVNDICRLYGSDCPTTDISCSDASDVSSFQSYLGAAVQIPKAQVSVSGFYTNVVTIPSGAKTMTIYVTGQPQNGLVVNILTD